MKTQVLKRYDWTMLFILFVFFLISLLFIYSSQQTGEYGTQNFMLKQGVNYIVGFGLLFLVAQLDVDQIEKLAWPSYITFFILIILLRLSPSSIAPMILGAKRWFIVPFLGSMQPSEYFKISLIILAASIISKHNSIYMEKTVKTDLLLVGKILLITIPPSIFVYQQPDTGMVFLYFIAIASMLYLSGLKKKLITVLVLGPSVITGILVYLYFFQPDIIFKHLIPLLQPHQQQRIIGWLNPNSNSNEAYQTQRSLLAVGSGELFGKGFLNGNVYVPEKHTDFIFSTVAEEGGFLFASFVILLFLLLIFRIMRMVHLSETSFGAYICTGIGLSMTAQIFQNLGMVVGLMPVKGISLPFLTYGGSSLFSNMILMGITLSIRKTFVNFMFSKKNEYF